ncbi:MAG: phosphotransferase [Akkermansiaceae bacterium]|nr:phosphotransferase [Akkermansiaceae bacterium]
MLLRELWGAVQVLVNVALRLADLHEAGWVHRDLKPGNVLWLPRKQRWTLIDFALATHEGVETPVIFTPSYAAPEIVKVCRLLLLGSCCSYRNLVLKLSTCRDVAGL